MRAFILAGGFATRLWPLTERRAKPLLPLAGKPLVEHLIEKISPDVPITISTNAVFKDAFQEWKDQLDRSDNISILVEDADHDDHKLGALGATAQWIEQEGIDDDVLLLTGDNYCGFSIDDFLNFASPDVPLLAAHDIGNIELASSFGTVIVKEDGKSIEAFEEKPKEPRTSLVSTGCSLIPKDKLPILVYYAKEHPDNIGGIFEEFLRRGIQVKCFQFSENWFDIGSFNAYLNATRTLVGENVILGEEVVEENTQCKGSVVIGDKSCVRDSTLEDVVLFEDCLIEDCILRDCILDRGCHLQGIDLTGKMLRENTKLK